MFIDLRFETISVLNNLKLKVMNLLNIIKYLVIVELFFFNSFLALFVMKMALT